VFLNFLHPLKFPVYISLSPVLTNRCNSVAGSPHLNKKSIVPDGMLSLEHHRMDGVHKARGHWTCKSCGMYSCVFA